MVGAIRKREILFHPIVTIRCFGWGVFLRALAAGPNQTFLSLVMESPGTAEAVVNVPGLVRRCVELERSAQRIYASLAERFADHPTVRKFLLTLSHQEQGHAELLSVCRAALRRGRFVEERFSPWVDAVPRLEDKMRQTEASLGDITHPDDALRCVIDIETSEINHVFLGVVGASDSEFVRRLNVFWQTGGKHERFIVENISRLAPQLAGKCGAMLGQRR